MQLSKVHHVAIIVSNYEVSRHFYVEILGIPVIRENYRDERDDYKLDLALGDMEFEIFSGKRLPSGRIIRKLVVCAIWLFMLKILMRLFRNCGKRGLKQNRYVWIPLLGTE